MLCISQTGSYSHWIMQILDAMVSTSKCLNKMWGRLLCWIWLVTDDLQSEPHNSIYCTSSDPSSKTCTDVVYPSTYHCVILPCLCWDFLSFHAVYVIGYNCNIDGGIWIKLHNKFIRLVHWTVQPLYKCSLLGFDLTTCQALCMHITKPVSVGLQCHWHCNTYMYCDNYTEAVKSIFTTVQ